MREHPLTSWFFAQEAKGFYKLKDADARLIAAAPELLEALEKVYTVMNDDMPVGLRKVCYEAIAKAKGE